MIETQNKYMEHCENQADEFMAYYHKSINQPLKPLSSITYI